MGSSIFTCISTSVIVRSIASWIACVWAIHGQSQTIPFFKNYDEDSGFPASVVYAISDDAYGFMWYCTDNGLYRFDGLNYHLYTHDPNDIHSIPRGISSSVFLDASDRLWITCSSNLCLYNAEKDHFERFSLNHDSEKNNTISAVFEDSKGNLYCCTEPYALFVFYPDRGIFGEPVIFKNDKGDPIRLKAGMEDADGTIWLASYYGIIAYNPDNGEQRIYSDFPLSCHGNGKLGIVNALIQDPNHQDELLCGTWGNGLVHFNKRTGTMRSNLFQPRSPSNINNIIFDLHLRNTSELWVATYLISLFDFKTEHFLPFRNEPYTPREFMEAEVRCIHQDRRNLFWFGTVSGLCVSDPSMDDITYTPVGDKLYGLTEIIFDKSRKQYYVFNVYTSRSLRVFDDQWKQLGIYSIPKADELFSEPFHVVELDDDIVWIGTTKQGIISFKRSTNEFVNTECIWPDDIVPERVYPLFFAHDKDSCIWMSSSAYGLMFYDRSNQTWTVQNDRLSSVGDHPSRIVKVVADSLDRIWCMQENIGLTGFALHGNEIWRFDDPELRDFIVREDGQLIGCSGTHGVFRLKREGSTLRMDTQVTAYAGQKLNSLLHVVEDKNSNIWLLFRNGLYKMTPQLVIESKYSGYSGLNGNFSETRLFNFDQEHILLPYSTGVYTIPTGGEGTQYAFKPIFLTSLLIHNTPAPFGMFAHIRQPLQLNYNQNSLTLEFNSLEFIQQEGLQYAYMLVGNDNNWIEGLNRHNVGYADLDHGSYAFKVRVRSPEGVWGPEQTLLQFDIMPAWWQTWYFKLACLILGIILLALLVRYYATRQLRARIKQMEYQRGVEQVRNRIARDIHDEIGSGLTKISLLSSRLEENEITGKIQHASREIIENMGEIIWAVNPDNDSLVNLAAHIRDVSGRYFEGTDVALTTDIPSLEADLRELMVSPELKRNCMLILKEALGNVLKHSQASEVQLKVSFSSSHIIMHVSDNGKGIPEQPRKGGNGLNNMNKRTQECGGRMQVESSQEGTRLTFVLPFVNKET